MNEQNATEKTKHSSFYLLDLIKQLIKGKNITAIIYLVLNVFIIACIFMILDVGDEWVCFPVAIAAYIVTAFLVLSPLGEWIIRLTQGCRKLRPKKAYDKEVLNRLEPLFFEVLERARTKREDLHIDSKINLYVQESPDLNAFAIGHRTICVTRGLLNCTDEQIKAVLGHEIGHLATHDTDLTLLITAGNFLVSACVTAVRLFIIAIKLIFSLALTAVGGAEGFVGRLTNNIWSLLTLLFVNIVMWLWTKIGVLLVMHSSRQAEYAADAFACDLGYTDGLLSFLNEFSDFEMHARRGAKMSLLDRLKAKTDMFAVLSSSHPKTYKRIERIKEAMAAK